MYMYLVEYVYYRIEIFLWSFEIGFNETKRSFVLIFVKIYQQFQRLKGHNYCSFILLIQSHIRAN